MYHGFKFPMIAFEGENGGVTGSVPITNPGQREEENTENKNNNGNNEDNFDTIWDAPENSDATKDENNNNNNNQQSQQNNAGEQFNEYVKSLDFGEGIDVETIQKDMAEGNLKSFHTAVQQAAANAYKRSVLDTHKVMQQTIDRAVEKAVGRARGEVGVDMSVRAMQKDLPFTKEKAIAPIAEQALKQFMKKGQDSETAIANVRKFFDAVGTKVSGGRGTIKNSGFNSNPNNRGNNDEADDELDFTSILTMSPDDED